MMKKIKPNKYNTCAVMVLFHPDDGLLERIESVLSQVDAIIIIANDGQDRENLISNKDERRIYYIMEANNIGLALALNKGIKVGIDAGFEWIILLDQDSLLHNNYLEEMGNIFDKVMTEGSKKIGFFAPNYQSFDKAKIAYPIDKATQIIRNCITSGSIIPVSTFQKIGLMKEEFLIEGIDTEYALRSRANGLNIITSKVVIMTHVAGEGITKRLFGRSIQVTNHNPLRVYLQYRNFIWILRNYIEVDPIWSLTSIISIIKRLLVILIYEKQQLLKIYMAIRGAIDGFQDSFLSDNIKIIKRL